MPCISYLVIIQKILHFVKGKNRKVLCFALRIAFSAVFLKLCVTLNFHCACLLESILFDFKLFDALIVRQFAVHELDLAPNNLVNFLLGERLARVFAGSTVNFLDCSHIRNHTSRYDKFLFTGNLFAVYHALCNFGNIRKQCLNFLRIDVFAVLRDDYIFTAAGDV